MFNHQLAGFAIAVAMLCGMITDGAADPLNPSTEGFVDNFKSLEQSDWYVAKYTATHPWFDVDWLPDAVTIEKGLNLALAPTPAGPKGFSAGSLRRHLPTGYGRYEVVMQPAKGEGVITGFFTYTGPYYGTRHDEIDIEFLGKDTTQIHVATFVDGDLTNKFIDLGFDAADRPRRYAFEWRPDSVRWFVGDKLIHEMTSADGTVPKFPGMLFANIWAADPKISNWSGTIKPGIAGTSRVSCISFAPLRGGEIAKPITQCTE
ncbi:MAG: family 16 glycosylhydrolase [Pseudomonadota bacterium]